MITCVISSTSSPRAAMSVAISVATRPEPNCDERPLARVLRHVPVQHRCAHVVLGGRACGRACRRRTSCGRRRARARARARAARRAVDLVLGGDGHELVSDRRRATFSTCAPVVNRAALTVYVRASAATGPSSVAEKRSVCRFCGISLTIRSTCGWKPMSSMRSASSRTSTRTSRSETSLRSIRSLSRPGVATRTSAPRAAVCLAGGPTCRRRPRRSAGRARRRAAEARRRSARRARASGRGRARRDARSRRRCARSCGMPKASVLPEPVGDAARTSTPASASGRTSVWMANGVWISRRARASITGALTPRAAND